jgi:hypothetical protein
MNLRSFLGLAAIGAACLSFASCSDDSDDDGASGSGGTATAGSGGSGTAGSGMAGTSVTGGGGSGAQTGNLSFGDDIWPILKAECGDCHESFAEFAAQDEATAYAAAIAPAYVGGPRYEALVSKLESGEMPANGICNGGMPGSPGCISVANFDKIKAWAESATPPPP